MPVISSKALASVFDSYSCVVMVSETTEISFTPLACSFLAASMNHFISAICWSLRQRGGLELAVDPLLGFGFAGPCALPEGQSGGREGHGVHAHLH